MSATKVKKLLPKGTFVCPKCGYALPPQPIAIRNASHPCPVMGGRQVYLDEVPEEVDVA